ncbi:MAG: YARHG domain-containing protein, partial [Clostridiales Family XIII bacterium]|nr:YARHG domain-containing protein [Clostridiales Family XIII bacterium]
RNEIYARHGAHFETAAVQEYFNKCAWYKDKNIVASNVKINALELENAEKIRKYAKKKFSKSSYF